MSWFMSRSSSSGGSSSSSAPSAPPLPPPPRPAAAAVAAQHRSEAEKHEECVICFDALYCRPVGMLMTVAPRSQSRQKVCNHYFHCDCLSGLRRPWLCPLCRRPYDEVRPLPALLPNNRSSAETWFALFDSDGNGTLSYQEIVDGLKTQVVLDWPRVEAEIDRLWRRWDRNGDGEICKEEFVRPGDGLLDYLTNNYGAQPKPSPPDITRDKVGWFHFWDEDNSGNLSKEEVTRALVKTFKLHHTPVHEIINVLDVIWPIFDVDDSGFIDLSEFCSADNLGDTVIAQLSVGNRK